MEAEKFINVLYEVVYSVDLTIAAIEDLYQEMDIPVDISSIETARESIDQTMLAVQRLDNAVQKAAQTPLQWEPDNLEVFTGTGVDRFRQEVQSANTMLDQLCSTQDTIAKQAYNTMLFPPAMFGDLNSMAVRVDTIRNRIWQIEENPMNMGTNVANTELEQLRMKLSQALAEQQSLNQAMERMDVSAANEAYLRLSQTVGNTERYIRDNVDEQGRFNRTVQEGTEKANQMVSKIKEVLSAFVTKENIGKAFQLSDELVSTTARLDTVNDGLQSTEALQNMIYFSAERARGSYQATADAVSQLGLTAGDAFSSSAEIVAFTEQVSKQFRIAGTEASSVEGAVSQITQVMSSGVLGAEEFSSILKQAPNIIQAIADYMEVPQEQLKDMAAKGQITSDIVKKAMFAAADETNAKFEGMPQTLSEIWTSFQNTALMAFQPVLLRINEIANSEAFQSFVSGAAEALSVVAGIALEIIDLLAGAASVIADNWSWLSPIIGGVAAALGVYYGWQLAVIAASAISKGLHIAMAGAQMLQAAATGSLTAGKVADIAAQNSLNAAMSACPIMWMIILIIALIAVFYAVIAAINEFAGTSISAAGVVCGAVAAGLAFIGNGLITMWNIAAGIIANLYNAFAGFANFFGNLFNDPVAAIIGLLVSMGDAILGIVEGALEALSWITLGALDYTDDIKEIRGDMNKWFDENYGEQYTEYVETVDPEALKMDLIDYGDAWDAGYHLGEQFEDSVGDLFSFDDPLKDGGSLLNGLNALNAMGDVPDDVGSIAEDTGNMSDAMGITGEELKYLRDIAEQEAVNRFTTAEIKIEQTNHNNVSSKLDLDGVVDGLTDAVNEAVGIITEGVHA